MIPLLCRRGTGIVPIVRKVVNSGNININQRYRRGMEETAVARLSSLANGIAVKRTADDRVKVTIEPNTNETTTSPTPSKNDSSSSSSSSSSSKNQSDNNTSNEIPDNVLQYERQLRKVQAEQRSVTPLTAEEHLEVLYDDDDVVLVNKPPGVLCVPGLHNKPNLLSLVCQHCNLPTTTTTTKTTKDDNGDDGNNKSIISSYIVHRLDMDTSGLVLFAKSSLAQKNLHAAFRDRQVDKEYHALLCGHLPLFFDSGGGGGGGDIHLPLQRDHAHPPFMRIATPRSEAEAAQAVEDLNTHGFKKLVKKKPKPSHTELQILSRETLTVLSKKSLSSTSGQEEEEEEEGDEKQQDLLMSFPVTRVLLIPHTGRTHQLRVHCAALGYPIVGDPAYGLYGEANPRGGLDENTDGTLPLLGASFEMQKALNAARPPHENPMCLHAARLSLKHPITGESLDWKAASAF